MTDCRAYSKKRQTPTNNYLKLIEFKTYYIKSNPLLSSLFPPTKHAMVPQNGPFSLHTMLDSEGM
jgi:hypothetical protein